MVTGFIPAALAITSSSTPQEQLPDAMGKLAASASAGRLLGPAIGGVLAGFLAFRQLFLVVAASIAVAAVFTALFLEEPPRDPTARRTSLIAPLRAAMRTWKLRIALPGMLIAMAAVSMTMPIFPLYVEDLCGPDVDPKVMTGIGFAVVAGFTLLGSMLLGRISDHVGLKLLVVLGLALAAVALALHPMVGRIAPMLGVRALLGIAIAGIAPVLHAMISREAPEGMRGGITGLANAATILGFFVGPIVGGWLANVSGVDGVFRSAAALSLACGIVAAVVLHRTGGERAIESLPRELPR
jgi:MFS family permease